MNTSMHNSEYNRLISSLNKNELIRQPDIDIPRFGVVGKNQPVVCQSSQNLGNAGRTYSRQVRTISAMKYNKKK